MADILFLAHRIPFPPDRGDKIRSFHILRHIAARATVHLACFADDEADAEHLAGLRQALGGALGAAHVEVRSPNRLAAVGALLGGGPVSTALFASRQMQAFVDRLLDEREIAAIFVFSGQMAQYVPIGTNHRFVMDFGDVDSAKFAEYGAKGRGPMAWLHRREGRKLLDFESRTAARADISLFVSEPETRLFRTLANLPAADIRALENGVDLNFHDPTANFPQLSAQERGEGPLIVFTGQMDYRPNVEAVTAFATTVMPRIRSQQPETRFAIVGRKPTPSIKRLEGLHGTRVIGAVEDVRSWVAAADVAVAPLAIARGIQNKVLEAMAMARPVVASMAAFEGIEAVPGRDLLVADDPVDQADAVLQLLRDAVAAAAIGRAARRHIEHSYGWNARLAPLPELLGLSPRREAA